MIILDYDKLIPLNGYCLKSNPTEYIEGEEHERLYLAIRHQDEWVIHINLGVETKQIDIDDVLEVYKKEVI